MSAVPATALAAGPSPAGWAAPGATALPSSSPARRIIVTDAGEVGDGMGGSGGEGSDLTGSFNAPVPRGTRTPHLPGRRGVDCSSSVMVGPAGRRSHRLP